jgi:Tol biopolymer transport system component
MFNMSKLILSFLCFFIVIGIGLPTYAQRVKVEWQLCDVSADGEHFLAIKTYILKYGNLYILNADGTTATQLTDDQFSYCGSWSPDETQIIFESVRAQDDEPRVFIMNADGTNVHPLMAKSILGFEANWSPDGKYVVFYKIGAGIAIFEFETTNIIELDVDGYSPIWSPDGQQIAFISANTENLFVMDKDGSNLQRLSDDDASVSYPAWSPDGSQIAFFSDRDAVEDIGVEDIYLVKLDGSGINRITEDKRYPKQLLWTSNGTEILYQSLLGGSLQAYRLNIESLERTMVFLGERYDGGSQSIGDISTLASLATSEQDFLVFAAQDGNVNHIFALSPNEGTLIRVTDGELSDSSPAWSPDGSRIAFARGAISDSGPFDTDIYTIDINGNNTQRITNIEPELFQDQSESPLPELFLTEPDVALTPSWSPDGLEIAFVISNPFLNKLDIFVMDADGSNIRQLTNDEFQSVDPVWSPDGEFIAFTSDRQGIDAIYTMRPDGSNIRRLSSPNADSSITPDWSPDGEFIAFSSGVPGQQEIYVMNADGSNIRRLTNNNYFDSVPAWSPDGKYIAFLGYIDDDSELFVMDADGSNIRRLTDNDTHEGAPSWKPANSSNS